MLVILSGLPGVGKTTIARELARRIGATHIRIDSIEQAIRDAGTLGGGLMNEAGYRVGYAMTDDNLRLGLTVIADSVNPVQITREAWRNVAVQAGVRSLDVEIICSDSIEHRRRIETRTSDIIGLALPTWQEVLSREYHAWNSDHTVIDTAAGSLEYDLFISKHSLSQ